MPLEMMACPAASSLQGKETGVFIHRGKLTHSNIRFKYRPYSLAVGMALDESRRVHEPAVPASAAYDLLQHVAALIRVGLER